MNSDIDPEFFLSMDDEEERWERMLEYHLLLNRDNIWINKQKEVKPMTISKIPTITDWLINWARAKYRVEPDEITKQLAEMFLKEQMKNRKDLDIYLGGIKRELSKNYTLKYWE